MHIQDLKKNKRVRKKVMTDQEIRDNVCMVHQDDKIIGIDRWEFEGREYVFVYMITSNFIIWKTEYLIRDGYLEYRKSFIAKFE